MKAFIQYFCVTRRTARFLLLVLLCWWLGGNVLPAATISWSGAGGDGLWSNPTNWTGGNLPTSEDDVVIDVPGDVTVRMDAYNVSVRSLQCAETFQLEYGPFRVTAGPSTISGPFRSAYNSGYYSALEARGVGTVLTMSGMVTNVSQLLASEGGVIALPTLRELTIDAAGTNPYYSSVSAYGAGSAVLMTNLTNLIVAPYYYFWVTASGGGRIDLSRLQSPDGPLQATANDPDSVVDLSGVTGRWGLGSDYFWWRSALNAGSGGRVLIPNVREFDQVDVAVSGANVVLNQIRSFTRGTLSLTSRTNGLDALTNFNGSLYASDARLDWTNFTVLPSTNAPFSISAYQGSVIDLSHVTALDAPDGSLSVSADQSSVIDLSRVTNVVAASYYGFRVAARSGSLIDLRELRQPGGFIYVDSYNSGSVVNLSGLTGLWEGNGSNVRADDGGTILMPNVTAMSKVSLLLAHDAVVPTAQIRSITDGYVTLTSRTNGFTGLTNFNGYFFLSDSRLDLTNFTVLYATNNYVYFQADQGSFIDLSRLTNVVSSSSGYYLAAYASGGSRIDLRRLPAQEAPVNISASGADSFVDLSGFSGLWRGGSVTASTDGTVLMPNVTALDGVYLTVSDSANVNLAQLNSIIAGNVTVRSRTNDLTGLTNFTGWLTAYDSQLHLTNLTELYVTNSYHMYITADQGSLIDLSSVTNAVMAGWTLNVSANNGGRVDLHRLQMPEGSITVNARDVGSFVDLSGFVGAWNGYGSVSASSGATVAISNVTSMHNISLYLASGANVPLDQINSFAEGYIQLSEQTNVFAALTNFTGTVYCYYLARAEFPALTQLIATNSAVSFSSGGDSVIDLSRATNAVVDSYSLGFYAYANGRIELPNLETILAGNVNATADGAGAVVDLSGLTGFFSSNNAGSLTARNGGTILLNDEAMLLAGVAIDFQDDPGGVLPPFLAPSQSLVLYGQPWLSYRVESRNPSVPGSPWSLYKRVPLTTPLEIIGPRPPRNLTLRVHAFIADPPEVDIRLSAADAVEPVIFGVPGRTYRLETTTSLNAPVAWADGPTRTLTNSFSIFSSATTNTTRFFRARQM